MKVNGSRKSTHSIMDHTKFGGMLYRNATAEVFIPPQFIFKNGKLKNYGKKMLREARKQIDRKVV